MEMYQIFAKDGQSLSDIAVAEYGSVEGVPLLIEDNPDTLTYFTDEPASGTILNIRIRPEGFEKLAYVREGRQLNTILVIGGGGEGECCDITAYLQDIKDELTTVLG
jgi:hypothetical protein